MLKITQIKIRVDKDQNILKNKILEILKISEKQLISYEILKRNIDAREHNNVSFSYSVIVEVTNENKILKNKKIKNVSKYEKDKEVVIKPGTEKLNNPIIVVGFGPAGIFAALTLSRNGYPVIVIERGKAVKERMQDIEKFNNGGSLNCESNVQFGEGGAGTFSDGKLTARSKDSRVKKVYETLVEFGADEEILYDAYPHIGSDKLREIIPKMRNEIINNGGKVIFEERVEKLIIENNKVKGLITSKDNCFMSDNIILAIGNSARDTFYNLNNQGVYLENKPFAIGMRIEHKQEMINNCLYHDFKDCDNLHAASYRLTHKCKNGKGVYTFCMCPGGEVVAATSLENHVCVNGMSYYARDLENANSAILVQVDETDYGSNLFDGIKFQEQLEKKAFEMGGNNYCAPVQKVVDYLKNNKSEEIGEVFPSYPIGYKLSNLNNLFSDKLNKSFYEALESFDKKIEGFTNEDAILTAVETRTSSPIRIVRDSKTLESISTIGLYPCGEGCGYAGGIVSSAIDGIRIAEKIISKYKKTID